MAWFNWGSLGHFVGRLAQYNPVLGTASSFSCPEPCQCDQDPADTFIRPTSLTGLPGQSYQLEAWEKHIRCGYVSYVLIEGVTFKTTNSNVVSIDGTRATLGFQTGKAKVSATWTTSAYFGTSGGCPVEFAPSILPPECEPVECDYLDVPFGGSGESPVTNYRYTVSASLGEIRPSGTGGTTVATVKVVTTPVVANQAVNFSAAAYANSGGHLFHTGVRPTGTFAATSGSTNTLGVFQTTYTAPIFGGTMQIIARMGNASAFEVLEISVPGLQELQTGANYYLIGYQNNIYHPEGTNHWGTMTANGGLVSIANDYKLRFYGAGAIPDGSKLAYNDQSLINGGKFDLTHNWSPTSDHSEHRVGINCDVRSFNVPTSRWEVLRQFFVDRGSANYNDETDTAQPHWHLRFE